MRYLSRAVLALGTALVATGGAGAQTVGSVPGVQYNAPSLTGFQTLGNLMGGMVVTATTTGGGVFSGTWQDLGGGNWGVATAAFSVTLGGNTDSFNNPWTLSALGGNQLAGLRFSGAPGGVVFDRDFNPFPGTVGSADGNDFSWVGGDMWRTLVTYTNIVAIGGAPPVGDIFEQVDIQFRDAFSQSATFVMDTDNIPPGTRLTPVPEPSTIILMASGLVAVAAIGRRRLSGRTDASA